MVYILGRILHTYELGIECIHMVEPECHGSGYGICLYVCESENEGVLSSMIMPNYHIILYRNKCYKRSTLLYFYPKTRYMSGKLFI